MKKALLTLSTIGTSIMLTTAQISINIGTGANQGQVNGSALLNLLGLAQALVNKSVPLFVGLAILAFFWFLIEFIWKGSGDPAKRQESLKGMGWSIVALFVMVSIWGLVGFLGSVTGIGQGGTIPIPGLPNPQ